MAEKQTKVSSFLSSLLPPVKVEPVYNQTQVITTGAIVFITAVLIMVAWFTFKKSIK